MLSPLEAGVAELESELTGGGRDESTSLVRRPGGADAGREYLGESVRRAGTDADHARVADLPRDAVLVRVRERRARCLELPAKRSGHVDLHRALASLAEAGLTRILVEGGGALAAAMLREGLIDEVHWMLAPMLIGADGRPALGPLELRRLGDAVRLEEARVARRGQDLHLHGWLTDPTHSMRARRTGPRARNQKGSQR